MPLVIRQPSQQNSILHPTKIVTHQSLQAGALV
jgi:hypothetical protein